MVYALTYSRPAQVRLSQSSLSGSEKQTSINESMDSGQTCVKAGIPAALSFDRIISGGTCPPVTTRDMMNYLMYIEHAAENLQFFLWFRDYSARWDKLSESEKALAPEWKQSQIDAEMYGAAQTRPAPVSAPVAALLKDALSEKSTPVVTVNRIDPFNTPPKAQSFDEKHDVHSDAAVSFSTEGKTSIKATAEQAFDEAGMLWKPFTSQPFRDEVTRIIATYLAEGSPRELNLSSRERQAALHALQHTTHPSAFRHIVSTVEYSLRKQAHPNFIRWTICNGNRPRVLFARGLGIAFILLALVADILLTLSHASRPWRLLPLIAWLLGIATLIAAIKGMCVVLHGLHHRHLRPWELFSDDAESRAEDPAFSRDSLMSDSKNSFETEPWVPRYQKRNLIRKIFDREIWVQEPALRQIQDTIFIQSMLGGLLLGCVIVGIFCAFPKGNFF